MEKYAWVTMITRDNYVKGVVTLAYSLLKNKSKYPLVILYTSKLSEEAQKLLKTLKNCEMKYVEPYRPECTKNIPYALPWFDEVWTKLRIFEMTEYDKLVYIDADMCVLQNMDELFDQPVDEEHIAACPDCLCNPLKLPGFPYWHSPDYCYLEGRPTKLHYFNAGLLVIKPSKELFNKLCEFINKTDLTQIYFAEQDILNKYFDKKCIMMNNCYNAMQGMKNTHPEVHDLKKVKNIHYAGHKPWNYDTMPDNDEIKTYWPLFEIWRDNYNNACKEYSLKLETQKVQ